MAKNTKRIAKKLGARIVVEMPDTGGGAFGMIRLGEILRERLQPGNGQRKGRPSDPSWVLREAVPMSEETRKRLTELANKMSTERRRISPMQLAAQLLEQSLDSVVEN